MMAKNDVGGTGSVNMEHWDQLVKTGKFESLDRSAKGGQKSVPYATEKLIKNLANTDILLLSGTKDAFSQPEDVEILKSFLPKDKTTHIVIEDYNHLDYMWAKDVDKNVNGHVYDFLKTN
jgi:lysosomal acid lipase/cholesteryl ester hydrolase